jgi:hypothetical protein
MSDRPTHLVIVTHPGQTGLELFSAHYGEDAARIMLTRMERLLAPAGSRAHLIEVPSSEGVADLGELPPLPLAPKQAAAPAPASTAQPAPEPKPFRRLSAEQFAEETRLLLEAEANGIVTDTPMPKYDGAFS